MWVYIKKIFAGEGRICLSQGTYNYIAQTPSQAPGWRGHISIHNNMGFVIGIQSHRVSGCYHKSIHMGITILLLECG